MFSRALIWRVFIGLCVSFAAALLLLPVWYGAALGWPPMDSLTMVMPQAIRNIVSERLVDNAHFDAKGLPLARRAVKLSPASEDAWTMYCATGARDGKHNAETLQACSRAESMNAISDYPDFHAQVIAEAYEEVGRPCDGLPILRKTMGEQKVNNISPIFAVGRLEATCGQMDEAEEHLRAVVRLRKEDLLPFNWEDRPPGPTDPPDSYEKAGRGYLSNARQNLSALLTLRHKDAEAFSVCRAALGLELKRCSCQFRPRGQVICDSSATE